MGNIVSSGGGTKPPQIVPSDLVVPLHTYDDTPVNRAVIVECLMQFDDANDKLEYHIPEYFDEKRPAVAYSHLRFDTEIAQDPVGGQLPRLSGGRSVELAIPEDVASLIRRPNGPRTLDDYLYTDAPQLSLHIVSFMDATIVSLSWPHTLLDAMGRKALLDAWIAVLEGRDDDVLPLHGFDKDPLENLGSNAQESYILDPFRLSTFQIILFSLRYTWETLIRHRGEETRIFRIPAAYLRSLRDAALATLASEAAINTTHDDDVGANLEKEPGPHSNKRNPLFLSEGDVLSAYIARLALHHLHPTHPDRLVVLMNALGMRSALASGDDALLPADRAYIGNAVAGAYAHVTVRELCGRPLAHAASRVRRAVVRQGTRAQIEARAAIDRGAAARGEVVAFGDVGMVPVVVSNWSKARFFDTDFSAAVVRTGAGGGGSEGAGETGRRLGRPVYIQPSGFVRGLPIRNSFQIVGKDGRGDYWVAGTLRRGLWEGMRAWMEEE
ncbi:hypothetical protein F5Y15DRAFT_423498 [Xylariaceae sp. FL0016]|nr:hypothetical protein F5Y15DRAFT_423498 [Xylariaceae sp. FL0016]